MNDTSQVLKEVLQRCAALGANQIESANPNVLAFEGLAVIVAKLTKRPQVLDVFINRVRRLQDAQPADPSYHLPEPGGSALDDAGHVGCDAK